MDRRILARRRDQGRSRREQQKTQGNPQPARRTHSGREADSKLHRRISHAPGSDTSREDRGHNFSKTVTDRARCKSYHVQFESPPNTERAEAYDSFVWIDMENSPYTEATVRAYMDIH